MPFPSRPVPLAGPLLWLGSSVFLAAVGYLPARRLERWAPIAGGLLTALFIAGLGARAFCEDNHTGNGSNWSNHSAASRGSFVVAVVLEVAALASCAGPHGRLGW